MNKRLQNGLCNRVISHGQRVFKMHSSHISDLTRLFLWSKLLAKKPNFKEWELPIDVRELFSRLYLVSDMKEIKINLPPLRLPLVTPPPRPKLHHKKKNRLKLRRTQIFILFFFFSFVYFYTYLFIEFLFLTHVLHYKAKQLQPIWPTQVLKLIPFDKTFNYHFVFKYLKCYSNKLYILPHKHIPKTH